MYERGADTHAHPHTGGLVPRASDLLKNEIMKIDRPRV